MTGFLASYWYFKAYDWTNHPGPLIIDSGAFSAYTTNAVIDLKEYAAYVHKVQAATDGLLFAINLDVIGDAAGSYRQWLALRDEGVNSVPVIHHGGDFASEVERYLAHDDVPRLAFGGLVGGGQRNLPWAAASLKYVARRAPHVLTHGLGVVEGSVSGRLPWDTTDSSAGTSSTRFGTLRLVAPGGRGGFVTLDLRKVTRPTRAESELIRSYGIEPAALRDEYAFARNEVLTRLAWRALVREEALENRRRAAVRARTGADTPRDVIRFSVNGSSTLAKFIREEMERPVELPTHGPGVMRLLNP